MGLLLVNLFKTSQFSEIQFPHIEIRVRKHLHGQSYRNKTAQLLVLETVAILLTLSEERFETWVRVMAVIVTGKRSLAAQRGFVLSFVSHRHTRGSQFMQPETHPHDLSPDRGVRLERVFRVFGGIFLGNESRGQLSQKLL